MLKQRQTVRMMGSRAGDQEVKKAQLDLFATVVASPSGSPPRQQPRRPLLRREGGREPRLFMNRVLFMSIGVE